MGAFLVEASHKAHVVASRKRGLEVACRRAPAAEYPPAEGSHAAEASLQVGPSHAEVAALAVEANHAEEANHAVEANHEAAASHVPASFRVEPSYLGASYQDQSVELAAIR